MVVLVVAADAGVQAQTVASIQSIRSEDLPVVVAISKSDLESADIDRVKRDLMDHGASPYSSSSSLIITEMR